MKHLKALLDKAREAEIGIFDEYNVGLFGLSPSASISTELYSKLPSEFAGHSWWDGVAGFALAAIDTGEQLANGESTEFINPLTEEEIQNAKKDFIALWNRIIALTAQGYDTDFAQELIELMKYEKLFMHKSINGKITLKPIEPLEEGLSVINNFVDDFTSKGKLSVLVDSYLPDINLSEHFKSQVSYFAWGDPNNTNSHIAYFCDTRKIYYYTMRYPQTQEYVQKTITELCNFHTNGKSENLNQILVVAMNTSMANLIKKWKAQNLIPSIPDDNITWYRSAITRGVQINGIVQIMVCGPYIPLVAYHHKKLLNADGSNKEAALRSALRKANMVSEFINASTRVKDPEAKRDSYIYCIGITKEEIKVFLDLDGRLYTDRTAEQPTVIGCITTGANVDDFINATVFFQNRALISNPQKDIPFLLKLQKAFLRAKMFSRQTTLSVSEIFRDKTAEASEIIDRNEQFLATLGITINKTNRGKSVSLNDKMLHKESIAGSCSLGATIADVENAVDARMLDF